MRDYKEVIESRFDKENEQSIYSADQPVGKYIRSVLFKELDKFVAAFQKHTVLELADVRLLDLGCGYGEMLFYFSEQGFAAENMMGIDLSTKRTNTAQEKYPQIKFSRQDAIHFQISDEKFDLITAFDLYSHVPDRTSITEGLKNVNKHLDEKGVFLWYDIYFKDHFSDSSNSDSCGFSKEQMLDLAKEAGFELFYSARLFKVFLGKYHSVYQVNRFGPSMIKTLEKLVPGTPGNLLLAFRKKKDE